jgi:glutathione S-transferase
MSTGDGRPVLWHIAISHYSEKARWALDHKRVPHRRHAVPAPGLHIPASSSLSRGASTTFPVLELDGRAIGDSTEIIAGHLRADLH